MIKPNNVLTENTIVRVIYLTLTVVDKYVSNTGV